MGDVLIVETWSARTFSWMCTTTWNCPTSVSLVSRPLISWVGPTAAVRRTLRPRCCWESRTTAVITTSGASVSYSISWSVGAVRAYPVFYPRDALLTRCILGPVSTAIVMCWRAIRKAFMSCNFNCLVETEGLLKVTGSHVHCKTGKRSETVQDTDIVTVDHLQ